MTTNYSLQDLSSLMIHVSSRALNSTNAALLGFFKPFMSRRALCIQSPELFVSVYYPVSLSVHVTEFVCVSVLCVVFSYEG